MTSPACRWPIYCVERPPIRHGEIISQNASPTASGNDGIAFQSSTTPELTTGTATVNNFSDGTIIGARHGITGKFAITVNNDGTITGQLGSGINLDTVSGTADVVNHGTISCTSGGAPIPRCRWPARPG